ncbi:hypothetical protein DSECCO2_365850 [anaerobic digester metagenome]
MGFVILAGGADGLHHLAKDVQPAGFCLLKRLCKHLIGHPVNLNVHLTGGDSVNSTGNLEVHISEVVFIAKDIAQHGKAAGFGI